MTPERFLSKLRESIAKLNYISLSVEDNQPCPQFEIRSSLKGTAIIKGYYCELGDSFIQISHSGREEFTNNDESAATFLSLIEDIVRLLAVNGFTEKQWLDPNGQVKRSLVELPLSGRRQVYRLGKRPKFLQGRLKLTEHKFPPLS